MEFHISDGRPPCAIKNTLDKGFRGIGVELLSEQRMESTWVEKQGSYSLLSQVVVDILLHQPLLSVSFLLLVNLPLVKETDYSPVTWNERLSSERTRSTYFNNHQKHPQNLTKTKGQNFFSKTYHNYILLKYLLAK